MTYVCVCIQGSKSLGNQFQGDWALRKLLIMQQHQPVKHVWPLFFNNSFNYFIQLLLCHVHSFHTSAWSSLQFSITWHLLPCFSSSKGLTVTVVHIHNCSYITSILNTLDGSITWCTYSSAVLLNRQDSHLINLGVSLSSSNRGTRQLLICAYHCRSLTRTLSPTNLQQLILQLSNWTRPELKNGDTAKN